MKAHHKKGAPDPLLTLRVNRRLPKVEEGEPKMCWGGREGTTLRRLDILQPCPSLPDTIFPCYIKGIYTRLHTSAYPLENLLSSNLAYP